MEFFSSTSSRCSRHRHSRLDWVALVLPRTRAPSVCCSNKMLPKTSIIARCCRGRNEQEGMEKGSKLPFRDFSKAPHQPSIYTHWTKHSCHISSHLAATEGGEQRLDLRRKDSGCWNMLLAVSVTLLVASSCQKCLTTWKLSLQAPHQVGLNP